MISILRLAAVMIVTAASTAFGQTTTLPEATSAPADSVSPNEVKTFSVKSGKIALSSAANPGPVYLPDGTYTNQLKLSLIILDGKIVRMQSSETGAITEIAAVHLTRQHGIMLKPSTNALMAVTDFPLPSGTFVSEDGKTSIRIVAARPTDFSLSATLEH